MMFTVRWRPILLGAAKATRGVALEANDSQERPDGEPETVDASRRTYLANERTYLAWWRSGLAAIALAIAVGAVLPQLSGINRDAGLVGVGVGFGVLGVTVVIYGAVRERVVARALKAGSYAPLPGLATAALTGAAALLGVAAVVVVLVS